MPESNFVKKNVATRKRNKLALYQNRMEGQTSRS